MDIAKCRVLLLSRFRDDFAIAGVGVFKSLAADHRLMPQSAVIVGQDNLVRAKQAGPVNHLHKVGTKGGR